MTGDNDADEIEAEDGEEQIDETVDLEEETVTDAWTGVFLTDSWGYGQTNVFFARITEVSDSGKTVKAQRVGASREAASKGSEHLRPSAEQFGDEFRLHVREIGGDMRFRGSYPTTNDGDMDKSTHMGQFRPFSNEAENTVRQTAPNHGH